MRYLKWLLLLLLCPVAARANITLGVTCTPASATSCSFPGGTHPQNGDLMLSWVYRSGSATAPTTATNWNVLATPSGSVNSGKLAWKYSDGTDTTCGTWTSATMAFCQVYRGAWITGGTLGGSFGNTSSTGTGASGALSYAAITMTNTFSSNDWVACGGGSLSGTIDSAPTGLTLRSGTTITNLMFGDSNGWIGTTNWAAAAGANPGVKWATACAELVPTPSTVTAINSSNYVVHEYNYGSDGGIATGNVTTDFRLIFPLAQPSSANNLVKLWLCLGYATTAPSISNIYANADTGHATWTFTTITNADTTDTTKCFVFYIAGAASGITSITVIPSVAWENAAARYTELRQIATSSPVDVSVAPNAAISSNGIYVGQTITTTATNDVVTQDCSAASMSGTTGGANSTAIYQSGGTTILDALPFRSIYGNGFLWANAAAITPTAALIGFTPNSQCITVGWKTSAAAGTQPTGPVVVKYDDHNQLTGASINEYSSNINTGDAELIILDGIQTASLTQFATLTDSVGNTYSTGSNTIFTPSGSASGNTGGFPNLALNCNMAAGPNLYQFGTVNTGTTQNFVFWELSGLINSSANGCYDSTAGVTTASSVGSVSSATSMPSITPSTTSGIVVASSEMGGGVYTMSITNPTCGNFMTVQYPNYQDTSGLSFGNMQGICINTSTSAQNWGWNNGGTTQFNATAIALKAPSTTTAIHHKVSVENQ